MITQKTKQRFIILVPLVSLILAIVAFNIHTLTSDDNAPKYSSDDILKTASLTTEIEFFFGLHTYFLNAYPEYTHEDISTDLMIKETFLKRNASDYEMAFKKDTNSPAIISTFHHKGIDEIFCEIGRYKFFFLLGDVTHCGDGKLVFLKEA